LDLKDKLAFVIFDVVEYAGKDLTNETLSVRRNYLEGLPKLTRVKIAEQWPVSIDKIKQIWANGGEGAILKRLDSTYRSGWRTPHWVKVKKIEAAELTIIGYLPGKNGPNSVFRLRHDDGRETNIKVLTDALIKEVHADPDKYLNKRVVISYMGLTSLGLFRHPTLDHILYV
jgi:ATP-dependent DNA ligase